MKTWKHFVSKRVFSAATVVNTGHGVFVLLWFDIIVVLSRFRSFSSRKSHKLHNTTHRFIYHLSRSTSNTDFIFWKQVCSQGKQTRKKQMCCNNSKLCVWHPWCLHLKIWAYRLRFLGVFTPKTPATGNAAKTKQNGRHYTSETRNGTANIMTVTHGT